MSSITFGEFSSEEIAQIFQQAGVSLTPPKRTPFATGIRRKTIKTTSIVPNETSEPAIMQINGHHGTTASPHSNGTSPSPSPVESSSTPVAAPQQRPKSWAALLKNVPSSPVRQSSPTPQQPHDKSEPTTEVASHKFTGIAEAVNSFTLSYDAPLLNPRGLINNVNTCYMNVILQPLLHCLPFYMMVKDIGARVVHSFESKTPLLDSMIEFINEFSPDSGDAGNEFGEPFVPEYVYEALRRQKRMDSVRGRHEDAQEFLGFLLNGLHEEMMGVLKEQTKSLNGDASFENDTENGWLEVGPKNRTSFLKSASSEESPISKIFEGKFRSVLRCPSVKDSVSLEPYQSLPLDIQPDNVVSIEDAIRNMTLPEEMHDYLSTNGEKVDATKQVYLEYLPSVLVLHIKRFVYDNVGGVQKLQKQVHYGSTLKISPEWMLASKKPSTATTYELFGAVYHHGRSAGGGHYTCDIKRRNGQWLHMDDTTITPVEEQDVLVSDHNTRMAEQLHAGQTAYILFYMRAPDE